MEIELGNWAQIITLLVGLLAPFVVACFTVWYNMMRTNEVIREMSTRNNVQDERLHAVQLQLVKLNAEVDGLAGKISVQLDALQDSLHTLTQRMNNSGMNSPGPRS